MLLAITMIMVLKPSKDLLIEFVRSESGKHLQRLYDIVSGSAAIKTHDHLLNYDPCLSVLLARSRDKQVQRSATALVHDNAPELGWLPYIGVSSGQAHQADP
jgi:hypothetical protein